MDSGSVPERSPCPVVSDDAAPPADAHLILPSFGGSIYVAALAALPASFGVAPAQGAPVDRYASLAPPQRIYLRLQRFLI
jgi:hypothetical protein